MARLLRLTAALLALQIVASSAPQWRIEMLDNSEAGKFSSLKIDKNGNAHVVYITEDYRHTLKYGFWDHALARWFTMTIADQASFCSMVLDSKQRPHVSYADFGSGKGTRLRYAFWDGTAWVKQGIPLNADAIAYYTSISLDANDYPTISYYEYEGPGGIGFVLRMRIASWNGSYWEARTVDQEGGSGKFNSVAIDSNDRLQIAYANVKAEHASLRYATWNGHSWDTEVLEGAEGPHPVFSVSLVVDKENNPHIAYSDVNNRLIKYATRRAGKWTIEVVAGVSVVGYPDRNGIAVDAEGNPYISYYDAGRGLLRVAYRRGGKWVSETVDRNLSGFTSSIQVTDRALWVTYADEINRGIKCARRDLDQTPDTAHNNSHLPSAAAQLVKK